MTPESRKYKGDDAKALLENPLLNDAFRQMGEYIDMQALACDPDNKDKAQRIIITRQILAGVKREIERLVDDGQIAQVEMRELEGRRKLFKFVR